MRNLNCKEFSEKLKEWRISHEVSNQGYHIQVQRQHNFYPTKKNYYNSESNKKLPYPSFKDVNDFLQWLGKNTY